VKLHADSPRTRKVNGKVNGKSNGKFNGKFNGKANGKANGKVNGAGAVVLSKRKGGHTQHTIPRNDPTRAAPSNLIGLPDDFWQDIIS
jgi:hypothetical protein